MGMLVVSLILVPTTAMMSDVLRGETLRHERGELLHLARGKQNEFAHLARVRFQNRQQAGTFSREGHPRLLYSLTASDEPSLGGIPGRLQAIHIFAWYDENDDLQLNPNETRVDLWTAVARAIP
jgi:hypothetical protein